MTEQPKLTLVEKIAAACNAVGGVEKLGKNTQGEGYKYVRATDIAKVFRHELFERGLVVIPDEHELTLGQFTTSKGYNMNTATLKMIYRVTDGTSEMSFGAFGYAMDSGDKALWKAKTGALKYFLRGLGIVPDEKDDPEADESVDKATSGAEIRKPQALRPTDTTIAPQKRVLDTPPVAPQFDYSGKHPLPPEADMPASDAPKKREWIQVRGNITEKQAARIFGIGKSRKLSNQQILEHIAAHGFEHTHDIPMGPTYEKICSELEIA